MDEQCLSMITADELTLSVSQALNKTSTQLQLNMNSSSMRQSKKATNLRKKYARNRVKKKGPSAGITEGRIYKNEDPSGNQGNTAEQSVLDIIGSSAPSTDSYGTTSNISTTSNTATPTRFILPRYTFSQLSKLVQKPVILLPLNHFNFQTNSVKESEPIQEQEMPKQLRSCNAGNRVEIPPDLLASDSRKLPGNLSQILANSSDKVCDDGHSTVGELAEIGSNMNCDDDILAQRNSLSGTIFEFESNIRSEASHYDLREEDHMMALTDDNSNRNMPDTHSQFLQLHQDTSKDSDYGRLVIAQQPDNATNSYPPISLTESSSQKSGFDGLYTSEHINHECFPSHIQQSSAENDGFQQNIHNSEHLHNPVTENHHFSSHSMDNSSHLIDSTDDNATFTNLSGLHVPGESLLTTAHHDSYAQQLHQHDGVYFPVYQDQRTNLANHETEQYQFSLERDTSVLNTITENHESVSSNQNNVQMNQQTFDNCSLNHQSDASRLQNLHVSVPQTSNLSPYKMFPVKQASMFNITPVGLSRVSLATSQAELYSNVTSSQHDQYNTGVYPSSLVVSPNMRTSSTEASCWRIGAGGDVVNRPVSRLPVIDFLLKPQQKTQADESQHVVVPYDITRLLSANHVLPTSHDHVSADHPSQFSEQLLSISNQLQQIANQINCHSQLPTLTNESIELNTPANHENVVEQDIDQSSNESSDETNYCVECNLSYLTPCTTHKLTYTPIHDTVVPTKARLSLPSCLTLTASQTSANATGVWCKEHIDRYTRFGPLVGHYKQQSKDDRQNEASSRHVWKIIYRGQTEVIDIHDENQSNWMMFVRPTPSVAQQNIVAFQQKRSIYFVTCRDIEPGQELLLWYAADYVLLLGLPSKPDEFKQCGVCRKFFPNSTALKQHLRYTHADTTRRKWKCPICDKALETRCKLRIHTLSHVGIKPHKCRFCEKSFTDKSNLSHHLLTHTGLRRFMCSECGKRFRQRSHLQSHALFHTQEKRYQCRFCDVMMARLCDLTKHELQHTQEVPYICDICQRSFPCQRNLTRHKKNIHTNVKEFDCLKCGKCFVSRYHRDRHLGKCKVGQ